MFLIYNMKHYIVSKSKIVVELMNKSSP